MVTLQKGLRGFQQRRRKRMASRMSSAGAGAAEAGRPAQRRRGRQEISGYARELLLDDNGEEICFEEARLAARMAGVGMSGASERAAAAGVPPPSPSPVVCSPQDIGSRIPTCHELVRKTSAAAADEAAALGPDSPYRNTAMAAAAEDVTGIWGPAVTSSAAAAVHGQLQPGV